MESYHFICIRVVFFWGEGAVSRMKYEKKTKTGQDRTRVLVLNKKKLNEQKLKKRQHRDSNYKMGRTEISTLKKGRTEITIL